MFRPPITHVESAGKSEPQDPKPPACAYADAGRFNWYLLHFVVMKHQQLVRQSAWRQFSCATSKHYCNVHHLELEILVTLKAVAASVGLIDGQNDHRYPAPVRPCQPDTENGRMYMVGVLALLQQDQDINIESAHIESSTSNTNHTIITIVIEAVQSCYSLSAVTAGSLQLVGWV